MDLMTLVMAVPVLAVLTNMLTNVVKGLAPLLSRHPQLIAAVTAQVLTMTALCAWIDLQQLQPAWYWFVGGAAAGGVVAYAAMEGYDGLYEDLVKHLKGLGGK